MALANGSYPISLTATRSDGVTNTLNSSITIGGDVFVNLGTISETGNLNQITPETIPTNTPPQLTTPKGDLVITTGSTGIIDCGVSFSDADLDDTLIYLDNNNLNVITGISWDSTTGIFTYDDTLPQGEYNASVTCSDSNGGVYPTDTFTITVIGELEPQATTLPAISDTDGVSVEVSLGGTYSDPLWTWRDDVSTDNPVTWSGDLVNVNETGSYTRTATATNNVGTVTETYMVTVLGIPRITLSGSALILIDKDQTFTDAGATAVDSSGDDITDLITVTGSVDTSTLGAYYLYYNVTDSSLRDAVEVVRTVIVTTVSVGSSIRLQGLGTNLTLRL